MLLALMGIVALVACRVPTSPPLPQPRAGVVMVVEVDAEALDQLGPVWYYRYGFEGPDLPGHQRLYLVPPHFDEQRLLRALEEHPESWWLVGNEPNDPHQDNLSPGAYAAFYRRFLETAQRARRPYFVATAGIANADWRWAQRFRDSYRAQFGEAPRVDAWNIHNYVLEPDRDPLDVAEFRRRILAFREWMARVGEGDKPLFLTEFGVLYSTGRDGEPLDPARVEAFIHETVGWLAATEHVQCWAWFANRTAGQFNGDLYDEQDRLTRYGVAYRDAIAPVIAQEMRE